MSNHKFIEGLACDPTAILLSAGDGLREFTSPAVDLRFECLDNACSRKLCTVYVSMRTAFFVDEIYGGCDVIELAVKGNVLEGC